MQHDTMKFRDKNTSLNFGTYSNRKAESYNHHSFRGTDVSGTHVSQSYMLYMHTSSEILIIFAFCLSTSIWVFISKYLKTQSVKLLIYLKKLLRCSISVFFKLLPVFQFDISRKSPDPKVSHYTRLADLTLSQLLPVRFFFLAHNHFGKGWLTPLWMFILHHTIHLEVWSWKTR